MHYTHTTCQLTLFNAADLLTASISLIQMIVNLSEIDIYFDSPYLFS